MLNGSCARIPHTNKTIKLSELCHGKASCVCLSLQEALLLLGLSQEALAVQVPQCFKLGTVSSYLIPPMFPECESHFNETSPFIVGQPF